MARKMFANQITPHDRASILFISFLLYFTKVKYKRKEINKIEALSWSVIWFANIFLAIFPAALDPIIKPLNFYRKLDFFVVIGFFVLLSLGFYNYSATKKLERKLEKFVRIQALQEPIEETKK